MKFEYDKETDSLYIELRPVRSIESEEVTPGIASEITDISRLPVSV